ncbi:hypothetical protein PSTG_03246 [Puccinia striiformis f. sp. tritici PST-78]|uniref:Alpha-type protein kinase domain-containing protein n=1 Tax=Puccinia striiformis f. sp. tritici PST-78 TaxID=1165861 RepID=A0A0L0VWN1_9BASI|nr:hypothetical protein PSTG_03246 [Puccinia striiformis f. sp. tritici PST-78]
MSTKAKAKQIQIVCHSVVFTGDLVVPGEIYFFEKYLPGNYVKYFSNANFNVPIDQPGMDPKVLELMNTLTHWTYNNSKGNSLIRD